MERFVYADNAATTKISKPVLDAMLPYLTEEYGNPSSLYRFGNQAKRAIEKARKEVADVLNADPFEIIFTAGGTEADNWVKEIMRSLKNKGKNHFITSAVEHHALIHSAQRLEKEGFEVTYIPVDREGQINPEDIKKAIRPETGLVSIMFANNEIGTIHPIKEIGAICREAGVLFHTDAVQAAGHIKIDVKEMNIDMSFDNIIKDQTDSKYKIIDYEWVFSFPIPVKFVIYRAVSAFYTRNGSAMKDIMTINEIYDCFDITEEEIVIFENMNEAFNQYVYGGKNGYNASLIAYKKEVYDVKKLLPEENLFLQVFLNDGTNYLEDKAITKPIMGQNVKLNIPIEFTQYVSEIRLDPLNVSCVLQNLKVQIVTKDNNEYEIEHYRHNAIITKDHDFIFASEDPQIIFENQWENNVREVKIAFRIREAGLQDNPILSALSELKCHMNQVENELEYIKGTKVYKTLLERKVDKVLGENE